MPDVYTTIEQGQLRGAESTDYNGAKIYKFLGIPYAQPPIDDLRFKTALPARPWTGILDATNEKDVSFQWDIRKKQFVGSEDCLYLNVYTKALPNGHHNTLKPVMVYIHGGNFNTGSNTIERYGPEFLLIEDIVLVTIKYRLGILGFLSFDDPNLEVPGNAGLKDIILALKWVQNNIAEFSGDAANVTIFGESAGSGAVHHLILSPLTEGLFHKAILQSGCALNYWALGQQITGDTCKTLGASNPRELLEMLRGIPLEKLYEVQTKLDGIQAPAMYRYLGPVVENTNLEPALISEDPLKIIKSGKYNQVPIIIGCTDFEGLLTMVYEALGLQFNKIEPHIPRNFKFQPESEGMKFVIDEINKFYFNGKEMSQADKLAIYRLKSDTDFIVDILATIKHHLKSSKFPMYLYQLTADTALNYYKKLCNIPHAGASHADDLGYLFKNELTPEIVSGSTEDILVKKIVKLWTNFARHGNPTPDTSLGITWSPTAAQTMTYLDIGEQLQLKQDLAKDSLVFWRRLYEKTPHLKDYL